MANYGKGTGNSISQFTIGPGGGLIPMNLPVVTVLTPASMAMDPGGSHLYVINEIAGTVLGYSVGSDGALGTVAPVTYIPTISAQPDPVSIAIDPYGKYAFVVDDRQDLIFPFNIVGDGTLIPLAPVPTGTAGTQPTEVIATWPQF